MKLAQLGSIGVRLHALQLRALLVALLAVACLVAGVELGVEAGTAGAGVPALDTPLLDLDGYPYRGLHNWTMIFLMMGLGALTFTPVTRWQSRAMVLFALLMTTLSFIKADPSARFLDLAPSRLEWALVRADLDGAQRAAAASILEGADKQYLLAQIELRAERRGEPHPNAQAVLALNATAAAPSDKSITMLDAMQLDSRRLVEIREALSTDPDQALVQYGPEAVAKADPHGQYGAPRPAVAPVGAPDAPPQTERFNREVVHALDVKLHGVARTVAGARREQANPGRAAGPSLGRRLAGGALGLALLVLSLAAAALWWRMVVRIQAIQAAGKAQPA